MSALAAAAAPVDAARWIDHAQPNRGARLRLFCLPYAGGSAALFRRWHGDVLNEIEVFPVQLPARERRISEAPLERISAVARALAQALPFDRPFALFGHSLGALVAFELARELRRQRGPSPEHLIASGAAAPQRCPNRPPRFRLAHEQFVAELRKLGGTPEAVLQNAELLELMMPALRGDFAMLDTYHYEAEAPLDCPITALAGTHDAEVDWADVLEWRAQTSVRFKHRQFPGDHFFVSALGDEVRAAIAAALAPADASAP